MKFEMKILAFGLITTLLIAGCVGQTPTGAATAVDSEPTGNEPVKTEIKQATDEPVVLPPGEAATCREVYDAESGQNILDCG